MKFKTLMAAVDTEMCSVGNTNPQHVKHAVPMALGGAAADPSHEQAGRMAGRMCTSHLLVAETL